MVLLHVDRAVVVVETAGLHTRLLVQCSGMQVPQAEHQAQLASVLVVVTVAVPG
jgi:hypothetical protein